MAGTCKVAARGAAVRPFQGLRGQSRRPLLAVLLAVAICAAWAICVPGALNASFVLGGALQSPGLAASKASPYASGVRGAAVQRRGTLVTVPGDIKNGLKILIDGVPMQIKSFLSKKVGKGVGICKVVALNLLNGATQEKSLGSGKKYEVFETEWTEATFSYFNAESSTYVFMHAETYEEIPLQANVVGEMGVWLTDGMKVDLEKYEGKYLQFRLQEEIILTVDSISSSSRSDDNVQVTLSNGVVKTGFAFLKVGDKVLINPVSFQISKRL